MTNTLRSAPVTHISFRRLRRGSSTIVVAALVAVATVAVTGSDGPTQAALDALGSGGEYHAVTPTRILDTRDPALDVAPSGRKAFTTLATDATFEVPVVGRGGLPAFVDGNGDGFDDNVLAVAVNVTVVLPTAPGFLRAWGTGAPEGTSSLVNFTRSQVVPNSAVLRPGAGGTLTVRLFTPTGPADADVLIDVSGWFSSSGYQATTNGSYGARLIPTAPGPGRIFDSREASGGSTPLGADEQREITIWGADAANPTVADIVPDSPNVVGVVLNITAVNNLPGSAPTFFSLTPDPIPAGTPRSTSNMNVNTGKFRSNLAIVPVSATGKVYLYNYAGSSHAILDVVGYLVKNQPPSTRAGRVIPLESPFRVFDTRLPEHGDAPLSPAFSESWSFKAFVQDVEIAGEPVGNQLGLLGNLTAAELVRRPDGGGRASFLTAYPRANPEAPPPTVSNIVIGEGEVVPNMALVTYGTDGTDPYMVQFYNRDGYLDYLLDVTAVILAD